MSEMEAMPKPQCGGGAASTDNYDVVLHVVALFLVLLASLFGAGFPVVAKKVRWLKIPPKLFFFTKHFGTGVLIATAFVHLLPTAFQSLGDPCLPDLFTTLYTPMPGVIMMGSLFILFVIEMWLHEKVGGHSHGGATGANLIPGRQPASQVLEKKTHYPNLRRADSVESLDDIALQKTSVKWASSDDASVYDNQDGLPSEMPPWFIAFYTRYVRQREEMLRMIQGQTPRIPFATNAGKEVQVSETYIDHDVEEQAVDPLVLKRMSLNITLLEGGILFHSVFVGMTVSITTDGFITLLIAILFHQMFEGLGLGSRIAAVPYAKKSTRPWLLVVAFGTTAPFGQFLGLVTRGSYDPNSAFGLIIVGVFNAISSGLLIYAALVDLLAQDFLSEEAVVEMPGKKKIWAFAFVLLGAMGMSIVGAFA